MLLWLVDECEYLVATWDEHFLGDDEASGICPSTVERVLGAFASPRDAERCVARRVDCLRLPHAQRPRWPYPWGLCLDLVVPNDCTFELWSGPGAPHYCWRLRPWVLDRGPAMLAEVLQAEWFLATALEIDSSEARGRSPRSISLEG